MDLDGFELVLALSNCIGMERNGLRVDGFVSSVQSVNLCQSIT